MLYIHERMKIEIEVEIAPADPTIGEPKPYMCDFIVVSVEGCTSESLCDFIHGVLDFNEIERAYKED